MTSDTASSPLEDRPQGRRMLGSLRSGQVQHVVAVKLDRLFRDAIDCLATTRDWDKLDITLHLIDMGGACLNTKTAMGRMFLTVAAGFAELERNLVSERTSQAMTHLKSEGRHVGSPALGYQMKDGILVEQTEELAVVQKIKQLLQQHLTLREIAAQLESDGVPTKRGGKWAPSGVRNVLVRKAK